MLTMLVQSSLGVFDGAVFDSRDSCPVCGGRLSGYDTRVRQFARLIDAGGARTISVKVKRFRCRSCGKICNADEPFYPETRTGSPVIDLCIAFSTHEGYGRAARNLSEMGVVMDRMQCRHYAQTPVRPVSVIPVYGLSLPQTIVSLSALAARPGEKSRIVGAEALAACGFPSAHRAALQPPLRPDKRDEGDEKDKEKDWQVEEPEDRGEDERAGEQDCGNQPGALH
jgi:hypothetical protein